MASQCHTRDSAAVAGRIQLLTDGAITTGTPPGVSCGRSHLPASQSISLIGGNGTVRRLARRLRPR